MASGFLNRETELKSLDRIWNEREGQLLLVWGRRRTGKSYLLSHFADKKPAIYYTATQRSSEVELAAFSEQARQLLRPDTRDFLASANFRSWEEALSYLAASAQRRRILVVLDEFSYLVEGDPSLPSVIQRFWDREGRTSKLRLVLCGSATQTLEALGAAHAPLFGRFAARIQVHPFGYREAARFHPSLSPTDQATLYGILGGMPLYLRQWDPEHDVHANLQRLFADPSSPFVDEGELLLRTELPEAAGYFRLMAAVAGGRTKFSEIRNETGMDPTRSLERLIRVRLLERLAPVTENPAKTKNRRYRLADNFLSFWFRFIYPNRGDIDRGLGSTIIKKSVRPYLDDHMGRAYEQLCRDFLVSASGTGRIPEFTALGQWWTTDGTTEIDAVALSGRKAVLAGEVKWTKNMDRRSLRILEDKAAKLPSRDANLRLLLCSRASITGVGQGEAIQLTADSLYL